MISFYEGEIMRKYDIEINDENIIDTLKKDYLHRNQKINKLIEIINVLDSNRVIAIDGRWGSGKTIFVKQIEKLSNMGQYENSIPNIGKENVEKFKGKFTTYYYNAWENDLHTNPLLSIIYNLIKEFPNEKKQSYNDEGLFPFKLNELLKTISGNAIDLDKCQSFEDITKEIKTIEEKREALNKLIDNILPSDKKLLFIIDELDRCKPSFAVNLLEILKHFFKNDKIIFIISTNNGQLSHVINNYYGNSFDGYSYLNKFYDLIIELEEININDYLKNVCNIQETSYYWNYALYGTTHYFKFTMREVNRLLSDYDLLSNYFENNDYYFQSNKIIKYIFLPYCLAMKIKNHTLLSNFLNGNGEEELVDFVFREEKIKVILNSEINNKVNNEKRTDEELKTYLKEEYNKYFNYTSEDRYNVEQIRNKFLDTFSLLGNSIIIGES